MIQWIATFLLKLLQGVVNPKLKAEIDQHLEETKALVLENSQLKAGIETLKADGAGLRVDIANLDSEVIRLRDEKIATVIMVTTALAGANDAHNKLEKILDEKPKPVSADPLHDLANRL